MPSELNCCIVPCNRQASFVDEIFAAAVTEHPARDCHFVVTDFDARSGEMLIINAADGQGNFRHAERLASVSAVENDISHFAPAEGFGRLFAEHPADGIGYI